MFCAGLQRVLAAVEPAHCPRMWRNPPSSHVLDDQVSGPWVRVSPFRSPQQRALIRLGNCVPCARLPNSKGTYFVLYNPQGLRTNTSSSGFWGFILYIADSEGDKFHGE